MSWPVVFPSEMRVIQKGSVFSIDLQVEPYVESHPRVCVDPLLVDDAVESFVGHFVRQVTTTRYVPR